MQAYCYTISGKHTVARADDLCHRCRAPQRVRSWQGGGRPGGNIEGAFSSAARTGELDACRRGHLASSEMNTEVRTAIEPLDD